MQKKNFVTLILSTAGGILFALGMCMALLPSGTPWYRALSSVSLARQSCWL